MCSIIGVGERLHKVLADWIRTLVSFDHGTLDSGEQSLPFGLLVSQVCRMIHGVRLHPHFRRGEVGQLVFGALA